MNDQDKALLEESLRHGSAEMKRESKERHERQRKTKEEHERKIKAASVPPVTDGWQGMDSIPKDGTVIDLWVATEFGGHRVTDISWGRNEFKETEHWHDDDGGEIPSWMLRKATAWMKWSKRT